MTIRLWKVLKRALAMVLTATISTGFLSANIIPVVSSVYTLNAMAATKEDKKGRLFIPQEGSVNDYNPMVNGYYGYLNVCYEVPGSNIGSVQDKYIPVLCYDDCIYVQPEILHQVTNLQCQIGDNRITITTETDTRQLYMTVDKSDYLYLEGYAGASRFPLIKQTIKNMKAPVQIEDNTYVPLNAVLSIFDMSPIVYDDFYYFSQPRRDALDVLLQLYDNSDHDKEIAGRYLSPDATIDDGSTMFATIWDFLYNPSIESWRICLPVSSKNEVDTYYYREIAKDVLSVDLDLAQKLDDVANENTQAYISLVNKICGIAAAIKEEETSKNHLKEELSTKLITKILNDLSYLKDPYAKSHKGFEYISPSDYDRLIKELALWDKVGKAVDISGLALDTVFALADNAKVYANSDIISGVGMAVLLRDNKPNADNNLGSLLSKEEASAFHKELESFMPNQWVDEMINGGADKGKYKATDKNETTSTVIGQSLDTIAIKALEFIIDTTLSAEMLGLKAGLAGYEFVLNCLNKNIFSDTEKQAQNRIKAYYIKKTIDKVGHELYTTEKEKLRSNISDQDFQELIALACIYLKLCKLECDYILNTSDAVPELVEKCKSHSVKFSEMIAILISEYPADLETEKAVLPDTAEERSQSARDFINQGIRSECVVPCYIQINGKVCEKNEEENPVEDAKCQTTNLYGYQKNFSVKKDGSFDVYIPLKEPVEALVADQKTEIENVSLEFKSERLNSTTSKKASTEPGDLCELGKVYMVDMTKEQNLTLEDLGLSYGWYEGVKPQGDGAIPTQLDLKEDGTFDLHCNFDLFSSKYTEHNYSGTYKINKINEDGYPVFSFHSKDRDFEMIFTGKTLEHENFFIFID